MRRFLHSKSCTVVGLLLFCVVVFLPQIIHGYVYPNVGDDTAAHLAIFDRMHAGDPASSQFILSYRIVGYPIIWFSNLTGTSIDSLFLWFNYVALALVGVTIYLVMSRLVNRRAGWLALVVTLFGAQGILFQFYYGQIFNAVNIGIILPLLLFFVVRYLREGKVWQFVLVLLLGGLFGSFHTSGIYLPFIAGFALISYLVWGLLRRCCIKVHFVLLGGSLVVLPAVAFLLLVPGIRELGYYATHNIGQAMAVPIGNYLMGIVSPTVLVLLAFVAIFWKDVMRSASENAKMLVILLCFTALVLVVTAFARLSLDPFRQALDLATVLALLVAVLVSGFVKFRNKMVPAVLLAAVAFGLLHNLPTWFDYNSAIRPADKEAIAYVNTLDYGSYNTSPEVAPWIYDRFTKAKWTEDVASLLIVRDLPMTPRSDPGNKWYDGHGIEVGGRFALEKTFNDGKVTVGVFTRR